MSETNRWRWDCVNRIEIFRASEQRERGLKFLRFVADRAFHTCAALGVWGESQRTTSLVLSSRKYNKISLKKFYITHSVILGGLCPHRPVRQLTYFVGLMPRRLADEILRQTNVFLRMTRRRVGAIHESPVNHIVCVI